MAEENPHSREQGRKLKLVHIHSDPKFVKEIAKYQTDFFDNRLIILGKKSQGNQAFHQTAEFIEKKAENIAQIVQMCEGADLVTLNFLCDFKSKIALALPREQKIAWRFFGTEIYSRMQEDVLSEATKDVLKQDLWRNNPVFRLAKYLRNYFRKDTFLPAAKRADILLGLFEEEYHHLKASWPDLPPFLTLGLRYEKVHYVSRQKEPYYILGNSRNIFNNHFELIEMVKSSTNTNYKAKMFFNYGTVSFYSRKVRQAALDVEQIELIEQFLPMESFEEVYAKASAMVLNGYRQMAMFNVFCAVRNGVKIYLNPKNPTMDWLLNNDIKVYPVKEFERDLATGQLSLTEDEIKDNIDGFNKLIDKFSLSTFQERLIIYCRSKLPLSKFKEIDNKSALPSS